MGALGTFLWSLVGWVLIGVVMGWIAVFLLHLDRRIDMPFYATFGVVGAVFGGLPVAHLFKVADFQRPVTVAAIIFAIIGAMITVAIFHGVSSKNGKKP